MLIIGLTGGIACGKSTAANIFKTFGVPVIEADQIARDLLAPGAPLLEKILDHFGPEIFDAQGHLNRNALKKIIFDDPTQRKWLEALLHPRIREEMTRQVNTLDAPYVILDIPLLLETPPNPLIDRVLVIDAPESLQIERLKARDHLSENEINQILKTQVPRETRRAHADDLVENTGNKKTLQLTLETLHHQYLSTANRASNTHDNPNNNTNNRVD